MNKMTSFAVKWKHSIRFKLFVMMSLYLLVTVVAISWQNGRNFWNLMTVQSTNSTLESSQKAASAFANLIELWSSTLYTLMHGRTELDLTSGDQGLLRSVLSSNKEFAGLTIFRIRPDGQVTRGSSEFTPYRESVFFEKIEPEEARKRLEASAKATAQNLAGAIKAAPTKPLPSRLIKSLAGNSGLESLELAIPFRLENSGDIELAVLHVWNERLKSLTEKKSNTESMVVSFDGHIFLSADPQRYPPGGTFTSKSLANLASGTVPNALEERKTSSGIPIFEGATTIPNTALAFVVQQNSNEIFEKIMAQMRNIALVSWMFLLVTILASYIATGRVTRKIQETVNATLRIASGDLETRIATQSKDELGILAYAVNHMASRIRNLLDVEIAAARQEKELKTAQTVQQTLFRENSHRGESVIISGFFEPASECAGDWWFDIKISDSKHLVIVADATGHGAPAALVVALAFSYFQTLALLMDSGKVAPPSPAQMLTDLNTLMVQSGRGKTTMTMFLGEIDSETLVVRYANAGHVAPLLIPQSATDERLPHKSKNPAKSRVLPFLGGGVMLGFDAASTYEERSLKLRPGDRLFFYTDGLTECMGTNGESLSSMDLRRQLASLADQGPRLNLRDAVVQIAHERLGNIARNDDLTVVVAEIPTNAVTSTSTGNQTTSSVGATTKGAVA